MIWYKQASNIEPQEPVEEIIKPLPVEEIATPSVQPTPIQLIQETQQPQDEMSATDYIRKSFKFYLVTNSD